MRRKRIVRRKAPLGIAAVLAVVPTVYWAASADEVATGRPSITVGSGVVRQADDSPALGWNVAWSHVQGTKLWDSKTFQVKKQVRDALPKLPNQIYRYPGGTASNYFHWHNSVGPFAKRGSIRDPDRGTFRPEFGFDEFMKFVGQVKGHSMITVNLNDPPSSSPKNKVPSNSAADWVEYANTAAGDGVNPGGGLDYAKERKANGHAAPYGIRHWELGNEMDLSGWKADKYIAKCKQFIAAMRKIDPKLKFIAHTRSSPWGHSDYNTWNKKVIKELGPYLEGLAYHPYYDGIPVKQVQGYAEELHQQIKKSANPDIKIWSTEHAKWVNTTDKTTHPYTTNMAWSKATGTGGALSSADYLIDMAKKPYYAGAQWHALAGVGPWQPFSAYNSANRSYSWTGFEARWITYVQKLLSEQLFNRSVLPTTVVSPNATKNAGGYDVSSIAVLDRDRSKLRIITVNRGGAYTASLDDGPYTVSDTTATISTIRDRTTGIATTRSRLSKVKGKLQLRLPARSVTVHVLSLR